METKPEEAALIFTEQVMPRMEQGGFPIDQALEAAAQEQSRGTEGLVFTLGRENSPEGHPLERLDMVIQSDEIRFGIGRVGPFSITVGAVKQILKERQENQK